MVMGKQHAVLGLGLGGICVSSVWLRDGGRGLWGWQPAGYDANVQHKAACLPQASHLLLCCGAPCVVFSLCRPSSSATSCCPCCTLTPASAHQRQRCCSTRGWLRTRQRRSAAPTREQVPRGPAL